MGFLFMVCVFLYTFQCAFDLNRGIYTLIYQTSIALFGDRFAEDLRKCCDVPIHCDHSGYDMAQVIHSY